MGRCWTSRGVALSSLLPALLFLLSAAGCGGGGGGTPPGRGVQPASGLLQVNITDAAADRLASFALQVNSVSLTSSTGTQVTLLSTPVLVEFTHLVGTTMPLATLTIPSGTYTQATIALGAPQVTYVDPTKQAQLLPISGAAPSLTIALAPQLQIGSTPQVLNLDLSLARSVLVATLNNVTFDPQMLQSQATLGGTPVTAFNGGLDRLIGKVNSVGASSLILQPAIAGQPITFTTNSTTQFLNLAGVSQTLAAGDIVAVTAQTQTDGTLLATRVVAINVQNNNIGIEGQVATTNSSPGFAVTRFQPIMTGIMGLGTVPQIGGGMDVDVTISTKFGFDGDGFDLAGLPFTPKFETSSDLVPGQFVEVDTIAASFTAGSAFMLSTLPTFGLMTAQQVLLEQQPLTGTVSNFTGGNTFTLTLPSDSVFATITGNTTPTITVFTQSKTQLINMTAITNNATNRIIVRGLLFFDGGAYKMVASRILPAT